MQIYSLSAGKRAGFLTDNSCIMAPKPNETKISPSISKYYEQQRPLEYNIFYSCFFFWHIHIWTVLCLLLT